MSKNPDKDQRRKKKLREREAAKRQRAAIVHDGDRRTVIRQGNNKGYDVEMVRDFLEQLLLEVRVQHWENLKLLKSLGATKDLKAAMEVTKEPSDNLIKQFQVFQRRYQSALIPSTIIDGKGATEAETKGVMRAVVQGQMEKRDEQIGHLEALQDLFKEALHCAKLPFGIAPDGDAVQPHVVHSVRELADSAFVAGLPQYEDLLPLFANHPMATPAGVQQLRNHDRSTIIVATNDAYDQPLVIYGAHLVEEQKHKGVDQVRVLPIPVASFNELRFVISAIAKFVGVPSTGGEPWQDL